jgi:membrane associated rhomboid family serine protease
VAGGRETATEGERRWPVATLALVVLGLGAFLVLGRGVDRAGQRIRVAEDAVWRRWAASPALDLDPGFVAAAVPPIWRRTVATELEARRVAIPAPVGAEPGAPQRELDDLTSAYSAALEAHPYQRVGLVPASPRPLGIAVGLVLFPGWAALLIGLVSLLLAGPALERAGGSRAVVAPYAAGAAVGLLVPALLFPASRWPVVAACAGVAAVLGSATARFAGGDLPLARLRRDRAAMAVPVALLLPCWLGLTMLANVVAPPADGRRTFALAFAVALGAALGSLSRLRGRVRAPAPAAASPDLAEGLELLAAGETASAREALERVLAADPGQPDANIAMWQSYLQDGMPGQGAEHMVRVIEADLRRRDPERAWEHWRELLTNAGTAGSSALRWRIAGELRAVDPVRARDVLTQLADDATAGIVSEKARHRLAAEPVAEAAPGPPADAPSPARGSEPPVAAPLEPGEAGLEAVSLPRLDTSAATAAWPPTLEQCRLERLQPDGLIVRGEDGTSRLLPYRSLEAIAVGGIADPAKPYVLLDLLPAAGPGRRRRVCRLVSTQFDPRRFVAQEGLAPMDAFRELVRVISGTSGARLLPGPEALREIPVFATPEAYDREVLGRLTRV